MKTIISFSISILVTLTIICMCHSESMTERIIVGAWIAFWLGMFIRILIDASDVIHVIRC